MISLQGFPPLDLQNGFLRAWWFEPLLAVACFGVFVNLYWYHERIRGLSCTSNFSDTLRFELGPLFSSALAYLAGIFLWKMVVPPAAPFIPDGIPHSLGDACYLLAELISGIILYDAIFFFIHWAMHEIPFLRSLHHRHHARPDGTVESRDTLRHSLVDGGLQVYINILVQRKSPWGMVKSRLARGLHNVIVIWMLAESHSASPYPNIWRRWFVGVREHRLHHLGTSGRYGRHHRHQQFFGYLDDLRAVIGSLEWSNLRLQCRQTRDKTK
jgi:sterol desaturase/sphingolipid hydroxylase (fatty acid hydroxylase superfamily)